MDEPGTNQPKAPQHTPGTYKARVIDWGFNKTQAGLDQVMALMEYKTPENATKRIIWFSGFKSEKATEITLKALFTLGMKVNDPSELVDDKGSPVEGALDTKKEVEIVIAIENDLQGHPRARVQWINAVGGAISMEKTGRPQLKQSLAHVQGIALAMRQSGGIQGAGGGAAPASGAPVAQGSFTEDDIPF